MKEISGQIFAKHLNGTISGRSSGGKKEIISKTTSEWNSTPTLVSVKDTIYVYTDYSEQGGDLIPNFKIGDGRAYLIDLPFVVPEGSTITQEQIDFWNGKVSVMQDPYDPENIIFYTGTG